jgi:hypothetical protein
MMLGAACRLLSSDVARAHKEGPLLKIDLFIFLNYHLTFDY